MTESRPPTSDAAQSEVRAHFYDARGSEVLEDSVIKRISLLGKAGALSIGLTACLALACGNEASNGDPEKQEDPPSNTDVDPVNECETNPYIEDCGGKTEEPPVKGPDQGPPTTGEEPPEKPGNLLKDQAQNILLSNCGGCHGSRL